MREAEFEKRFQGDAPEARLDVAWDKYFATEGPFNAWAALKERTDWMVARAKGPYVLDVGCGGGLLSRLASLKPGVVSVLAVDPLQAACDLAEAGAMARSAPRAGGLRTCHSTVTATHTLSSWERRYNTFSIRARPWQRRIE